MPVAGCRFTAACHAQRGCDRRDIPIAARGADAPRGRFRAVRVSFLLH